MNSGLHDFTGSFCIAAMSMFSPAYALTNIELAVERKAYSFLNGTGLVSPVLYLS